MAYIFSQGQCTKDQLYDTLLNLMIAAGWSNITSNFSTDGDVMYNTGINEDKELIINLIPYSGHSAYQVAASAANNTARSTRTTTYSIWGVRTEQSYTPGASGVAGTFSHPARAFSNVYLHSGLNPGVNWSLGTNPGATNWAIPLDTIMNYVYYIDKSKVIFGIKAPDAYGPNWSFMYLGLPDTLYAKCDGGRGSIAALTFTQAYANGIIPQAEYPDNGGSALLTGATIYQPNLQFIDSQISPNQNSKYFLSDLYYSHATYGMIGKLDGIWGLHNSNMVSGDTVTIDGIVYTLFNVQTPSGIYTGSSYFPVSNNLYYKALALRLS